MSHTPDRPSPYLSLSHIRHRFGEREVLKNITLEIANGEVICLAGPSGCGKSTLLRLIAGLEQLQAGELQIRQQTIASAKGQLLPEQRSIGMVFQDFALFPHLTIVDNVAFGLGHLSRTERRQRALAMLERVGLASRAKDYPHHLSGGQQQRIALARALAPEPHILLLDEPFSNLDVRLRHHIRQQTLALLKATGTTSILVTHDPDEAMFMADRIALMFDGHILQTGSPEQLYRHPANAFAAEFLGDVNHLQGEVTSGTVDTPFGKLPAPELPEGSRVQILIRPEALKPALFAPHLEQQLAAQVQEVHMLGANTSVVLQTATDLLMMQVNNDVQLGAGDALQIALDPRGAFIFPEAPG